MYATRKTGAPNIPQEVDMAQMSAREAPKRNRGSDLHISHSCVAVVRCVFGGLWGDAILHFHRNPELTVQLEVDNSGVLVRGAQDYEFVSAKSLQGQVGIEPDGRIAVAGRSSLPEG